ncbi:YbaN family protein [Chelatococcus sambhunathii]|uniref:YbaN family protein n=1 Tax=Chelatococcus sambhunathii TaxID=363953 RepID=A0ABU1DE82_9HYPH|nr:YbaN family protein [Chelatococcus sambhunathii]MDR4306423.1 YbaN family protein [Chelatococcus sambhunathii]
MHLPTPPRRPRTAPAPGAASRLAWLAGGLALTALGVVGLILPVMPGTIFLILAAGCFARGSPRLERWLLEHPQLGPSVVAWRSDGAIPMKGKIAAFAGMGLSIVLVSLSGAPPVAIAATVALVLAGALYVGSRPTRAKR